MRHFDGIARDLFSGDNINRNDGIMRDYYRFMIAEVEEKSGSDLTDYTVKADLSTIDWNSIRNDGNDIRIVHESKELDRILEDFSKAAKTGNVWFKVSAISANSKKKFLMLYGNQAADAPPSDGMKVYLFYDDFEDGYVGDWISAGVSISPADIGYYGAKSIRFYTTGEEEGEAYKDLPSPLTGTLLYETVEYHPPITRSDGYWEMVDSSGYYVTGHGNPRTGNDFAVYIQGAEKWIMPRVINKWYKNEWIVDFSAKKFDLYFTNLTDKGARTKIADQLSFFSPLASDISRLRKGDGSPAAGMNIDEYVDQMLVRKYTSPEPSVSLRWT